MSLRTYSLITHPKYLRHVEVKLFGSAGLQMDGNDVVPRIEKISDLSEYLKISPNTIRFALINTPKYYRHFEIQKKRGGTRQIHAPRLFLKVLQWWIKDTILDLLPYDDSVHGFVRGRSFVSNAKCHIGARHVLNVDIKSCFDSVDAKLLENVFIGAGYNAAVSLQLSALCSLNGALPQGAPTSPGLLNQVLRDFDRCMREHCNAKNMIYTRYADDLTISSAKFIDPAILSVISNGLGPIKLCLNESKTRFMGPNSQQMVTGLVLGANRVNLPPKYLNALRGWFGRLEQVDSISVDELERIRGEISLLRSVGGAKVEQLSARGLNIISRHKAEVPT